MLVNGGHARNNNNNMRNNNYKNSNRKSMDSDDNDQLEVRAVVRKSVEVEVKYERKI